MREAEPDGKRDGEPRRGSGEHAGPQRHKEDAQFPRFPGGEARALKEAGSALEHEKEGEQERKQGEEGGKRDRGPVFPGKGEAVKRAGGSGGGPQRGQGEVFFDRITRGHDGGLPFEVAQGVPRGNLNRLRIGEEPDKEKAVECYFVSYLPQ
ncbi:MAG: hypothetical protein MdMp014T_0220 [Treponematales bacterium]